MVSYAALSGSMMCCSFAFLSPFLFHSVSVLPYCCIVASLCCCIAVSLCRCVAVSLYRCIVASLYHCIAVLLYCCVAASLYRCRRLCCIAVSVMDVARPPVW